MTTTGHELPPTLDEVQFTTSTHNALAYAELSSDYNPIHVDKDFATKTAFGRPIAHGTMSIGFVLEALAKTFGGGRSVAEMDIRFVKPAYVGQTIRAGGRLLDPAGAVYEVFAETTEGVRTLEGTLRLSAPSAA